MEIVIHTMCVSKQLYEIAPHCTDTMSDKDLEKRVDFITTVLHDYYEPLQFPDINPVKFNMIKQYRETQLLHTMDMIEQRNTSLPKE
jgi:hypothetical protein